jgi:lycopene cyclase domain-containing protein
MIPPTYTYLLVNAGCIIVPLLFSFHPKLKFYREWRFFLLPCLIIAGLFLAWDILFTDWGVWHFNKKYTIGIFWAGLPVEEYLFFICIPFACVFTYHAFTTLFTFQHLQKFTVTTYSVLCIILTIVALLHQQALYTVTTFMLLVLVLSCLLLMRSNFLGAFFMCYLFILIPFTISNGVLTGSFFDRVVVSYNDEENLGIRLLTIPVEDIFYGKLLLLLNVAGFEWGRQTKQLIADS